MRENTEPEKPSVEVVEPGDPADPRGSPKKRKRAAQDEHGMDRPHFLLDFPEDPELEVLITAFETGNYRKVRAEAEALAGRTKSPEVRDAALELRRRIDPDPLVKYLLWVSFALLFFLTLWAYRK